MTTRRLDLQIVGKYTGNGGVKEINLEFKPMFVKVYSPEGHKTTRRFGEDDCKLHYVSWSGSLSFGTHEEAIEITDTGFKVRSDYTNRNGKVYEFIAIQKEEEF